MGMNPPSLVTGHPSHSDSSSSAAITPHRCLRRQHWRHLGGDDGVMGGSFLTKLSSGRSIDFSTMNCSSSSALPADWGDCSTLFIEGGSPAILQSAGNGTDQETVKMELDGSQEQASSLLSQDGSMMVRGLIE